MNAKNFEQTTLQSALYIQTNVNPRSNIFNFGYPSHPGSSLIGNGDLTL